MELEGQVAIITGAGRGIGRTTALELARMGADIVVAELDRANAERTASEVRGLGRRALVVPTDVTSRNDLSVEAGKCSMTPPRFTGARPVSDKALKPLPYLARNWKFESTPLQRGDGMGQAARKWHHRRCKVTDGVP